MTTLRTLDGRDVSLPLGYAEAGQGHAPADLLFLMPKEGLRVLVAAGELVRLLASGDIRAL